MSRNGKTAIIIALVCIAVGLVFVLRRPASQTQPPGQPADQTTTLPEYAGIRAPSNAAAPAVSSPTPAESAIAAAKRYVAPPPPVATPFQFGTADTPPNMEPSTVVENMRIAINLYRSMFGNNPVGTNPEITRALNGENPKQAKLLKEEAGLRINSKGELVDYWGTPFFFHQLSGTQMEIHSAGPDRQMWTGDDIVIK